MVSTSVPQLDRLEEVAAKAGNWLVDVNTGRRGGHRGATMTTEEECRRVDAQSSRVYSGPVPEQQEITKVKDRAPNLEQITDGLKDRETHDLSASQRA